MNDGRSCWEGKLKLAWPPAVEEEEEEEAGQKEFMVGSEWGESRESEDGCW